MLIGLYRHAAAFKRGLEPVPCTDDINEALFADFVPFQRRIEELLLRELQSSEHALTLSRASLRTMARVILRSASAGFAKQVDEADAAQPRLLARMAAAVEHCIAFTACGGAQPLLRALAVVFKSHCTQLLAVATSVRSRRKDSGACICLTRCVSNTAQPPMRACSRPVCGSSRAAVRSPPCPSPTSDT